MRYVSLPQALDITMDFFYQGISRAIPLRLVRMEITGKIQLMYDLAFMHSLSGIV